MNCQKCGAENSYSAVFCSKCGEKLVSNTHDDLLAAVDKTVYNNAALANPYQSPTATIIEESDSTGWVYVGFWARFMAYLVDFLIGLVILLIIGFGITFAIRLNIFNMWARNHLTYPIFALILLFYYSILESSVWQASVGKKLIGAKVVDIHGDKISFARALGRTLFKITISAWVFDIGFIVIGFSNKKQGWHDRIASTFVIKR